MGIGGGRAIALLDDDGREVKVAGSKTRFIEGGLYATYLADNSTVVYLTGGGPFTIMRVRPVRRARPRFLRGTRFKPWCGMPKTIERTPWETV